MRARKRFVIGIFLGMLLASCASIPTPCETEPLPIRVFIDPAYGCHYIREGLRGEYYRNRNGPDGRQVCEIPPDGLFKIPPSRDASN